MRHPAAGFAIGESCSEHRLPAWQVAAVVGRELAGGGSQHLRQHTVSRKVFAVSL